ncbi:MFS transporter [Rhodopila sp.]|uniref:MFS transporter n=1 Tax=Rhodopila sp. TaxID=2480087 RepID=UPI003D0B6088
METNQSVSRVMWFFAIVYAVEGVCQAKSGVIWQPLSYFLKQTQGWDPVKISVSLAVLDLPWIIKPLYGAVSDFVPLFGYRRRFYLLAANAAAVLAFALVASLSSTRSLIPALTITAFAMAISSTLCGALLVETGQRHDASARFVNQQWLWYNIAQMGAVLLAGYLIETLSPLGALHTAAWIAAVAPAAIIASIWLIQEHRARLDLPALRERLAALLTAFRTRNLWLVAGFLFLYYFSPGFGTPLYFQMSDRLKFSQGFIGVLASVSAGGWILGGLLYRWKLRGIGKPALLRLSIAGGVVATLLYLLLVGPATAVVIWLISGIAAMIATIATLSLAADSCPEGAEGFAFAGLMSIINLTSPLSDMLGSVLYQHVFNQHLTPLILVSAAATALVFFLIPLMVFRTRPTGASRA